MASGDWRKLFYHALVRQDCAPNFAGRVRVVSEQSEADVRRRKALDGLDVRSQLMSDFTARVASRQQASAICAAMQDCN
jgi:hypothetical protein